MTQKNLTMKDILNKSKELFNISMIDTSDLNPEDETYPEQLRNKIYPLYQHDYAFYFTEDKRWYKFEVFKSEVKSIINIQVLSDTFLSKIVKVDQKN